jgi:hypothetical protein
MMPERGCSVMQRCGWMTKRQRDPACSVPGGTVSTSWRARIRIDRLYPSGWHLHGASGSRLHLRHRKGSPFWGRFGAVDYESDRPSVGSDGTAVYPGWKLVSGEQRGQAEAVVPSAQCASFERITSEPDRLFFAGLELFAGEGLPPRLNYRKKPKPDQGAREWLSFVGMLLDSSIAKVLL